MQSIIFITYLFLENSAILMRGNIIPTLSSVLKSFLIARPRQLRRNFRKRKEAVFHACNTAVFNSGSIETLTENWLDILCVSKIDIIIRTYGTQIASVVR